MAGRGDAPFHERTVEALATARGETFITESKSSRAGENGPARRRYSKIVMLYFIVVGQLLRNASGRWPVGLLRNGHQPVHEGGLILYHHYGHSLEPFNRWLCFVVRGLLYQTELVRGGGFLFLELEIL